MGACWSHESIENESMLAELDSCSVVERSAGDEVVQNLPGGAPAPGGSLEYVGAYVGDDTAHKNTVEPMLPVSNDQPEQSVLRVSPNVDQNSTEQIFDFPIENIGSTNLDQPIIYQTVEEQPVAQETEYQILEEQPVPEYQTLEEQPVMLPVSNNQVEEAMPAVSSDVNYDNQNYNEAVLGVPTETTGETIAEEPLYQPFEEHLMDQRTLNNQIIEEQPVIETVHNQIFEEQLVHPISFGDQAVLPAQSSETPASVEVHEDIQVVGTQPPGQDLGVVFEGRTYRTRVFDPNLKEYVYVVGDYVEPRGGLVM